MGPKVGSKVGSKIESKVEPKVISFHYTLKDKEGELLDSSRDSEPLAFLQGVHQIVPGLEEVLVTMNVGDKKKVNVPAAKAYGAYHEQLVQKVARAQMPEGEIQVGDRFEAGSGDKLMIVTVAAINDVEITLDGNHPLAGKDLFFDVEITEVRPATQDEVAHGHAHGPDGHHH